MTDEFENYNDIEYSNDYGLAEEEVDKLNDLTFGDEKSWINDNFSFENNDSNFELFKFDEFESTEKHRKDSHNDRNSKETDNLLGLKGSFFDFGIFKSPNKDDNEFIANNQIDKDFEFAMGKLHLLDSQNDFKFQQKGEFPVFIESPFVELSKYSETLFLQFQDYKQSNNSSQFLNSIVSKHLNLLKKKLAELSLPMDVLAQIRYFRLLTTFITVDNRINEIRARCAADNRLYQAEMASLAQQFNCQSLEQQSDLVAIHPFFGTLAGELKRARSAECGWMSKPEWEWMARVQTRAYGLDAENQHSGRQEHGDAQQSQYRPPQFTDSLGVIAAASVNKPRKIIDVVPPPAAVLPRTSAQGGAKGDRDAYRPVRAWRELLGVVEKVHCTVLRVEEVDKALAQTVLAGHLGNRTVLMQHRAYLLKVIMDGVQGSSDRNDRLVQLFSVSKGARILLSVLALVDPAQFLQLLRTLFFNCLSVWESACFSEVAAEMRAVVVSRVRQLGRGELSVLVTTFFCAHVSPANHHGRAQGQQQQGPLVGFCRSEFGLSVVLTVLDAFSQISPDDSANISQLVALTLRSSSSPQTSVQRVLQDFQALCPPLN